MIARWLFALAAFALSLAPAPAQVGPTGTAQATGTSAWGVLAELAGKDFEVESSNISAAPAWGASFRWEDGNIVEHLFSPWQRPLRNRMVTTYSLDPATGIILVNRPNSSGTVGFRTSARVSADGSLVGEGERPFGLRRAAGGTYVMTSGRGGLLHRPEWTYRPIAQARPRIREALALRTANGIPAATSNSVANLATNVPPTAPLGAPANAVVATVAPAMQIGVASLALGPRLALVIGVSNYGPLGSLTNPVNDAQALAATLQALGFDVDLVLDPNQRTLREAISRLGERMGRAGRGTTGLFFFAGHGIQSRGVNYLIPSGAMINREADLALEAVAADTILLQMQEAGVSTNIIILDACRNMPFTRSFRNSGRGLAQMDAPNGTFIAYSTAPGSVAADGQGPNSPFASALLREIAQPGQPIEAVFRNVRRSVLQTTDGLQTPWDSSSLTEPFYFRAQ